LHGGSIESLVGRAMDHKNWLTIKQQPIFVQPSAVQRDRLSIAKPSLEKYNNNVRFSLNQSNHHQTISKQAKCIYTLHWCYLYLKAKAEDADKLHTYRRPSKTQ
jgi:hypothetical protein